MRTQKMYVSHYLYEDRTQDANLELYEDRMGIVSQICKTR